MQYYRSLLLISILKENAKYRIQFKSPCVLKIVLKMDQRSSLQGKSLLCIPFLGKAWPQSQFPHFCVCERFIYSQDRSTYFPAAEKADPSWKFINLSQIYECRNWETEYYNSDLEITDSFLGTHTWKPDTYI